MYEYRCTECGHRFEKIQSFSSEPELICPKCKGALMRPLTAPAFNFKGAGWYVNDYSSSKSSAPSDAAPAPASTETKSDSATPTAAPSAPAATAAPAASASTTAASS